MLQRLESPDTVLAIQAVGKVEKDDYRSVLEPGVAALLADHGEIRLVYVIGDAFDGYSFGADWEDTKFGFSHLAHWTRCAIVTDRDWIRHGIGMFHWMMPGELQVFAGSDVDAAIAWAAG